MSTFNRLLSRKEKDKRESKDNSGALNGVFVEEDKSKKAHKDEEVKIKAIQHTLAKRGITSFKDSDVSFALSTPYASGDKDKGYELLSLVADSESGVILPYRVEVKLLGAVNRDSVTCWLDALLFAMFARLGSFEGMLYQKFEDPQKNRLAVLLRLWINILRSGKLVTVDITKQIQLQLANCGWKEAAYVCQHDASEAFTFITETLALPLLTLKMDIFHVGKEDQKDDHKYINERLLDLAIPEETQDCQTVTLEDCLEMFFNNKIEVKRYLDALERRNTLSSVRSKSSFDSNKAQAAHIDVAEISDSQPSSPLPQSGNTPLSPSRPPLQRHRAPSIIQEHYIDEKRGLRNADGEGRQMRLRKEVMMPAWQFFRLIPWYTDKQPVNDAQVAAHFSTTRPVLGICLKRYGVHNNGMTYKKRTHVDIPLEIGLPHFISDDDVSEDGPIFGNFKLSLQSFVCHDGRSVDSGHYISYSRTPNVSGIGQDQWLRFDDLAKERVIEVSIEERLKRESPYLLFYQVVPIGDSTPPNGQEPLYDEAPPAYAESETSKPPASSTERSSTVMSSDGWDNQRYSTETSISEEDRWGQRSLTIDRKASAGSTTDGTLTKAAAPNIEIAPAQDAPQIESSQIAEGDDSALQSANLPATRRGSNISKASSKSRPTSSSGENRFSMGLSRLTKRSSNDKLKTAVESTESAPTTATAPDREKDDTAGKGKKGVREKSKVGRREHHLLSKGKKPDRECNLM